ncbi:MKRN2 opposite strand protein [Sarcophilus harrisii]|uniref:MKRN2 opposite strand n=1 Tax=Sarcophilus harrisii TaxID=9305 RepID=G3WB01_SARHA|nr:MKRN2 opposite strand protein [Sarcophilus harrisii]XP_031811307.1 MKRN2 opposite strand protein [Sarcophilus harrisii]XP_031811313.1 MKRN2 opposite strand protein [Sarcophilus harrisii]XP_031811315.1 MKRN2 opposite strand protein [Sarcophilus harrisii]XP_031811322.1 MKRN2 opposite strand protein [Sarcophilus harrisii]XP_031811327.1 MKRN2 opposite strand protein [Sarcophilus harrisii]
MHPPEAGHPVVRFRHCGKNIYCFRVPDFCPVCHQPMSFRTLDEAPITIATPLIHGHQEQCAFLLKPTQGTFLREYDGNADLHVGITNTHGTVYNYNEQGIHRDDAGWEESISIPLLQPNMFRLMYRWDKYLEEFSATDAWSPNRYEEHCYNCYTYALTFINSILAAEGRHQLDKNKFTEKFVVPKTRRAAKYITLYRAIEEKGFCVIDRCDSDASRP